MALISFSVNCVLPLSLFCMELSDMPMYLASPCWEYLFLFSSIKRFGKIVLTSFQSPECCANLRKRKFYAKKISSTSFAVRLKAARKSWISFLVKSDSPDIFRARVAGLMPRIEATSEAFMLCSIYLALKRFLLNILHPPFLP